MLWMVVLWLQAALASEPISVQNPEDVLCPPLVPCERRLDVERLKFANQTSTDPPPPEPLSTDPVVNYYENFATEASDSEDLDEEPTVFPLPSSRSVPEHGTVEDEVEEETTEPMTVKPALEQRRISSFDDSNQEQRALFGKPQVFAPPQPQPIFFNTPKPANFFKRPPPPQDHVKATKIEKTESHVRVERKFDPVSGKTEVCECRTIMTATVERKPIRDVHRETIRIVSPYVEETRLRITAKEPKLRTPILLKSIPDPSTEDLSTAVGSKVNSNSFYRFRNPSLMKVSNTDFYPQLDKDSEEMDLIEVTTSEPNYVFYGEPGSDARLYGGFEQQYTSVNSWRPSYSTEFWTSHVESMDHNERGEDEVCLMLKNKGNQHSRDEYSDDDTEVSGQYTSKVFRPVGSTRVSIQTALPPKVFQETRIQRTRPRPYEGRTYIDWARVTRKHRNERRITRYPRVRTKRPDNWETLYLKGSLQRQRDAEGREQPWKEQFHFRRQSKSRESPQIKTVKKLIRQAQSVSSVRNTRRANRAGYDTVNGYEEHPDTFSRQELEKALMRSRSTAEDDKHIPREQQGAVEGAQEMDTEEDILLNQSECGMVGVKPRVVNGKLAAEGQFPWLSYLRIFREDVSFMCAASIITPRYVLTAAHCLLQAGVPPTSMEAVCGVVNKTEGDPIPVHSYKMHPDYGRVPREKHDIALLRLDSRVDHRTARPICVPDEEFDFDTSTTNVVATVAGWGFNKDKTKHKDAKRSQVLMFADLKMMPGDVCAEYANLKLVSFDPDVQICTLGNDTDTCYGDSGGPVMVRERGRHVQFGVVSFGFSCAAPDMPAVSTKVSAHLDWIRQTIRNWQLDADVQRL